MARDANGNFLYDSSTNNPVVSGTVIASDWANNTLADIAATLQDSLSRSGKGPMTATLRLADAAGTLAVGGLTFDSERNTGIYRPAANKLAVCISGTDVILLSRASDAIGNTYTCPGSPTACAHIFDNATDVHALDIAQFYNGPTKAPATGVLEAKIGYEGTFYGAGLRGWTNGALSTAANNYKDGNVAATAIAHIWDTSRAHTGGTSVYQWNNNGTLLMYLDSVGTLHTAPGGGANIAGAVVVGTTLVVGTTASIGTDLGVTGKSTVGDTLTVTGAATLNGGTAVNEDSHGDALTVKGNVYFQNGDLGGQTQFQERLYVKGVSTATGKAVLQMECRTLHNNEFPDTTTPDIGSMIMVKNLDIGGYPISLYVCTKTGTAIAGWTRVTMPNS